MTRATLALVGLALGMLASAGCHPWHRPWRRGTTAEEEAPVEQKKVPPIDLNRASERAVGELPGITPSMAAKIVAGRPYASPDELLDRHILTRRELERIQDRVVVHDAGPKR